ncbi:rhomboid family protein [Allobacillus halotolerans]|uniref:Rhomboid family intramembrane serine protease n=1 Tax=Allobacillus halotolerans TaxID=570278 RepID=A0ABS6GLY9_9BACI|nr:rhomboid family intramembrane serine protease [Allobacillus halotolerans]MBU6079655.1 rhomboid family intramembrane serine protease [Allobacillus halotolerans]
MYITERYTLLRTVEYLVNQEQFNLIQIMPNQKEYLLEKTEKGSTHIVTISHQTFDWAKQLERDIQGKTESFFRQNPPRGRNKYYLHFVYISDLLPVDHWEHLLEDRQLKKNKRFSSSVYLFSEEYKQQEFNRLLSRMGRDPSNLFDKLPTIEEQESYTQYIEQQLYSTYKQQQREIKETFHYGKPKWIFILIALNLFIFMYMESVGSSTNTKDLIDFGAKYNPAIVEGEWWRIFTSMFLHIGAMHLFMNMMALYFLGEAVERIFGSKRFLFIYLFAGLFGGVASFATNDAIAAGASGAIFGLFGALLFFGVHYKRLFFQTMGSSLFIVIGINLVFGFTIPQIDNGAHLGGLIGGFIASQIVHLPYKKAIVKQFAATLIYVVIIAGLVVYGVNRADSLDNPHTFSATAQELISEGSYDETIELVNDELDRGSEEAYLYFYRGIAYFEKSEIDLAEDDFHTAVEIDRDFAEAFFNLAVVHSRLMEAEEALKYAEKAIELQPDNEEFEKFYQKLKQ